MSLRTQAFLLRSSAEEIVDYEDDHDVCRSSAGAAPLLVPGSIALGVLRKRHAQC